jgi:hypothetical protein
VQQRLFFSFQCLFPDRHVAVLNGEKEMAMHAAATGHGSFAEIKK